MKIADLSYHARVLCVSALVMVLAVVLIALDSRRSYEYAIAQATRESSNLVRALEAHALRTVQAVDNALVGLAARVERVEREALGALIEDSLDARLKRILLGLPQLSALSILDSQGHMVASSTPDVNRNIDSSLFREHLPKSAAGSARLRTVMGQRDSLLSYRTVGTMPLVINADFNEEDVLAGWRSTLVTSCLLAAGAILLVGFATFLLLRSRQSSLVLAAERRAREDAQAAEAANAVSRQALAISEERFALVAKASCFGIWDWCIVTGEAYFSERFCELMGYRKEELASRMDAWRELIHPEDRAGIGRAEQRHLEFREPYDVEMRICAKSGEYIWFRTRGLAVWNGSGQPIRMVGSISDLTALKLSQKTLRESESSLTQAQRIAHIGSWDLNLISGELHWSDEIFRIFGLDKHAFGATYEAFLNAIHPDDRAMVSEAYENSLVTREPYEIAHRLCTPDGSVKWVNEHGETLYDERGTALRSIGTVQDISDLKRTQDQLAQHQVDLQELVAQRTAELQLAQRMGRIGNWVMTSSGESLTWSDEIFRIFGHEPGAFAPSYEAFLATVDPVDLHEVRESVENAIANRASHSLDHRIVLPGGELRWVHEEARAQCDANGVVVGLAGTVQDITERKLTEQALIEARQAAEAANLAKSSFLASMSHELRTPLNSVLGYAQLLTMDEHASEGTLENAAEIEKAGRHLLSLVNDILDLARIESGAMETTIEDVSLAEVLEDCQRLIGPMAQARSIQLELPPLQASAVVLRADRTRLAQALLNLLSNAIKYNREGGRVSVHGAPQAQGHYRISVTDTGEGLAPERIGALFQPFNRLGAESGPVEGTGIGLVITKALVEAMHGAMGVSSVTGKGSNFWVDLPLA